MKSKFQFFPQEKTSYERKSTVQSNQNPRLLCLKGQAGTLACRVHDPLSTNILPERSPWGRLKYAWLSEEKMNNLVAVRGRPGAGMVGPADYFYDLERSDQYLYTIDISPKRFPVLTQHPLNSCHFSSNNLKTLPEDKLTKINARWFSGFNEEGIRSKKAEYNESSVFGGNLFQKSGILEIDGPKELKLPVFDPKGIDLSAFKARLVPNDEPFQITAERLNVDDEYCAISYQFDADYADEQVKNGGGIFLEFHEFAQTITPLDFDASGFVTLAKWNKRHTQLELIAIQIPYGHTLIIEKNCIHGDSTLNGLFMMCMTSDHISMATADTVFLKHAASKDNISLKLENTHNNKQLRSNRLSDPLVFYDENRDRGFAKFINRTDEMDIIFTPTKGYWEVKKDSIGTLALLLLAGASVVAAIFLVQTMLIIATVLLTIAIILAGIGLFRAFNQPEAPIESNVVSEAFAL